MRKVEIVKGKQRHRKIVWRGDQFVPEFGGEVGLATALRALHTYDEWFLSSDPRLKVLQDVL
jgi:hypothetical protein